LEDVVKVSNPNPHANRQEYHKQTTKSVCGGWKEGGVTLFMMRMDGSHGKMMTKPPNKTTFQVVNSHIKQDDISLKLQQYADRQNKWMRGLRDLMLFKMRRRRQSYKK
jgi:hypothetical protein